MLRDRYTVKQLAAHWGCSVQTVYNRIKDGSLPCLPGAGVLRIARKAVEQYEKRGALRLPDPRRPEPGPITLPVARASNDAYQLGRLIAGRLLAEQRERQAQLDGVSNPEVRGANQSRLP
jgi:hypothetical protein